MAQLGFTALNEMGANISQNRHPQEAPLALVALPGLSHSSSPECRYTYAPDVTKVRCGRPHPTLQLPAECYLSQQANLGSNIMM